MPDLNPDQVGEMARRIAIHVHGATPDTAPPALTGYAAALKAAVTCLAVASKDITNAPKEAIFAALANLARNGLIPGAAGDKTATAYLYLQNRALVGKPNPNGRLLMARAAGVEVHTLSVGSADRVKLGEDGDVVDVAIDPDRRPVAWGDLRGVVVTLESLQTGAVRRLWVSAAEIGVRKAKSSSGDRGPWSSDPVGMARSKAVSIAVDRGDIPQAPLLSAAALAVLSGAQPAALPAPAPRALPAPEPSQPSQDAPPTEDAPAPEPTPAAQPEATQAPTEAQAPAAPTGPTWAQVFTDLCRDVARAATEAGLQVAPDDLRAAVRSELDATRSAYAGMLPSSALDVRVDLTTAAVDRLRSM